MRRDCVSILSIGIKETSKTVFSQILVSVDSQSFHEKYAVIAICSRPEAVFHLMAAHGIHIHYSK